MGIGYTPIRIINIILSFWTFFEFSFDDNGAADYESCALTRPHTAPRWALTAILYSNSYIGTAACIIVMFFADSTFFSITALHRCIYLQQVCIYNIDYRALSCLEHTVSNSLADVADSSHNIIYCNNN